MLSPQEKRAFLKGQVIALHKAGFSSIEIAKNVQCCERTVRKYISRYFDMGEEGLIDWRRYNGRKREPMTEEKVCVDSEPTE
ncbi:hypothetical protein ANTQUA_LOCUS7030 [Anthophora quadrimaculata]